MEYLHHFQLSEDPFRNDHLERFLTETPSQGEALQRLDRGVRQGRGLVVLTGPVGSGKTVVARRLFEDLEEEVFEASMMMILRHRADASWLLRRFAGELGVEAPETQREALIGQIYERLAIIREDGRHAVLIVDEAQALAAEPETLAELCALVRLEYEDRRMLTLVLVGSTRLEEMLRSQPELAHHVEVRVALSGFGAEEAATYLGHRLTVAGGDPQLLLPGAVAALRELSRGAPGRMNCLADNALYEAFLAGRAQVTRTDVERAAADLGWGPAVNGESAPTASAPPRGVSRATRPAREPRAFAEVTSPEVDPDLSDLDSELEAVFEPAGRGGAPARAAAPARSRPASRSFAEPTEIQLEAGDVVLEAPEKEEDEVDGLFMELLDD